MKIELKQIKVTCGATDEPSPDMSQVTFTGLISDTQVGDVADAMKARKRFYIVFDDEQSSSDAQQAMLEEMKAIRGLLESICADTDAIRYK